jgi:hypothetical protein
MPALCANGREGRGATLFPERGWPSAARGRPGVPALSALAARVTYATSTGAATLGEMRLAAVIAVTVSLLSVAAASAVPPLLSGVSHERRHPKATVTAPRTSSVTIYIANRPNRASDGSFLTAYVKAVDFLTDQEIQTGAWVHERTLDPGKWYLMARASAQSSCYSYPPPEYKAVIDAACAHGYSGVATLTIPKPMPRYRAKVEFLRHIRIVQLTLGAAPLGEDRAYRVCWRRANRKRVCVRGTLDGFDWGSGTSDRLRVSARGMARVTMFTWQVGGRTVAGMRARTR